MRVGGNVQFRYGNREECKENRDNANNNVVATQQKVQLSFEENRKDKDYTNLGSEELKI